MSDGAVATSIKLLRTLSRSTSTRGISELGAELNLHKSRVHRLLGTLAAAGFVRKDPQNGRYSLGWDFFELAHGPGRDELLRLIAGEWLDKLRVAIPGRVQLCTLQSGTNVVIDSWDGKYHFSLLEAIGTRRPAYYGAAGKVLMAYTDAEIRRELLPQKLKQFTEKSLSDLAEFEALLEPIRRQGYALSDEETVKWVRGIAVPIFGPNGEFLAAISMALPVQELPNAKIETYARRMKQTAKSICDALRVRT